MAGNLFARGDSEALLKNNVPMNVRVFENMKSLHLTQHQINDKDLVYVEGFRVRDDGGGGFFMFYENVIITPVYKDSTEVFLAGYSETSTYYNGKWDGMVVSRDVRFDGTPGTWVRQWDRSKINIRWVGGNPGGYDTSIALNTALYYATLDTEEIDFFDEEAYTNKAKTIFFPSGRYLFKSPIADITKGVLIEGEGNMGLSDHSTHFIILSLAQLSGLDETTSQNSGFFRFVTDNSNNSGGGFKDLHISVETATITPPNLILLETSGVYDITYWRTQNISVALEGKALRSIYMKGDVGRRSIRNISLMNSWFAGNAQSKESILAENVERLQIIGGFLSSGRGLAGENPRDSVPRSEPGVTLKGSLGCAYVQINDLDLTHGFIEIGDKSYSTHISCRFARLRIYKPAGAEHVDLNVSEQHYINERILSGSAGVFSCDGETDYKCYSFVREIEDDSSWD